MHLRLTHRARASRAAAAFTAAAAAAVLALSVSACGGGGDDSSAEEPAPSPSVEGEDGGSDEPTDDGIPDETVPTDELTPAEGEFTEEQQEYLTDRVPAGADPAAILELGQEACDRLGYLERHDPEGVADALNEGEIPDAEAAIEHLCPEYAELLTQSE
ncbi:hypothetical protein [Streptomyces sp. NBC_01803]|uniref:hypothetical protein n=1 Tax=Streptomyces sp. NBC_01803 TaxID=2975946 RepID=UPI002DDA8180|nr:hypothetical protein [Streptomyces sp. NBC_01803]WSA46521.1 hypothetical protein OIE51_21445 [Streptomyces sp. NBC_01803]